MKKGAKQNIGICVRCGNRFQRTGNYQKFCPECYLEKDKTRKKIEWRAKQNHRVGFLVCQQCGREVQRNSSMQKFCKTCKEIEYKETTKRYNKKYFQENPEFRGKYDYPEIQEKRRKRYCEAVSFLNNRFKDSVGHHLSFTLIGFIPKSIHLRFYPHQPDIPSKNLDVLNSVSYAEGFYNTYIIDGAPQTINRGE